VIKTRKLYQKTVYIYEIDKKKKNAKKMQFICLGEVFFLTYTLMDAPTFVLKHMYILGY